MITDEQKIFWKKTGAGIFLLLVLLVLVWAALSNARDVRFNTSTLADVEVLRSELEYYYYMHNQYPPGLDSIISGDLPLNYDIQAYEYAACDKNGENCGSPEKRGSYLLGYNLRSAAGIKEGRYAATPGSVLNRRQITDNR